MAKILCCEGVDMKLSWLHLEAIATANTVITPPNTADQDPAVPGTVDRGAWGEIVNAFHNESDRNLQKFAELVSDLRAHEWTCVYVPDAYVYAEENNTRPEEYRAPEEYKDLSEYLACQIADNRGSESWSIPKSQEDIKNIYEYLAKHLGLNVRKIRAMAFDLVGNRSQERKDPADWWKSYGQ